MAAACLQNLLTLCTSPECDHQRAYVGTMIEGRNHVNRNPRHKWHNAAYIAHAGVYEYAPYAFGGGYFLSLDVVKVRLSSDTQLSSKVSGST